MDRRALILSPLLAVPTAVVAAPSLPDHAAIRAFSVLGISHTVALGREITSDSQRILFERLVGPLPYTFRSAHDGRPVTVTGFAHHGGMLLTDADGRSI